ncbi:hypothetical protein BSLG_006835 [Batrachochytrium salamandrivorans]|nr:hypothetical protein BSLG_006835 [Batrachochytrium salamandrivorans]
MIYTSPYPPVVVPEQDIPSFIFGSEGFKRNLDGPALIDSESGQVITFRELQQSARCFAAGLIHLLAFRKSEVVAVYTPNNINYSTIAFGTLMAGKCGSLSGINPSYTTEEVAYQLKDSGSSVLIVSPDLTDNACAAAKRVGIPADRIFVLAEHPIGSLRTFSSLLSELPLPTITFTSDELKNTPAYLCYSSGTTGRSKGVITTHRNMVANVLQMSSFDMDAKSPADLWMGVLPFYHIYGLNIALHQAAYSGIPLCVVPKFEFEKFLASVQKYQATVLHVVPPIVLGLAKHPIVSKYNLTSVRRIMSGAAPLGRELSEATSKRFKVPVVQGYGLTETSPVAHACPMDQVVDGSVGFLVPSMEARIVDVDTGKGQPGELWLRGPNVMKGYINNPKATAECIDTKGFFHTGDIAIVVKSGHFFIVDRLKELIKYKGFQVPPAELEAKLNSHPSIADAAVISRPDEYAGELPLAYVVLQPGMTLTEKQVQMYVAERVAPHKQLRGGVVFVDAIPKAASGKILRRVLRVMDKEMRTRAKL